MTPADVSPGTDPLAPVRAALLARARDDAARQVAEADAEAAATLARAEREAARIRDEARAQGEADAETLHVAERTRARRQARAVVLQAQREAYEQLRRQAHGAVGGLRGDPAYAEVRDRLAARVRALLGDDADVTDDPAGGVVGRAGGRRVILTLDALVDRVLDEPGPELDGLWSP